MPARGVSLINGEVYHVYNRSIANFQIFNSDIDYNRMVELMSYYIIEDVPLSFSIYKSLKNIELTNLKQIVDIVAYCLMPTHIHFVLKQNRNKGIEKFMSLISNSYSKYFNALYARKGPLWEGRFKNVLVNNDEQLLHLTRYVHLNPVTAFLIDDPGDWEYSSYNEYMTAEIRENKLCRYGGLLNIDKALYKKFVTDGIDCQRELAIIKNVLLEGCSTPTPGVERRGLK
jgi:Transposase IS200 like.